MNKSIIDDFKSAFELPLVKRSISNALTDSKMRVIACLLGSSIPLTIIAYKYRLLVLGVLILLLLLISLILCFEAILEDFES